MIKFDIGTIRGRWGIVPSIWESKLILTQVETPIIIKLSFADNCVLQERKDLNELDINEIILSHSWN